MKVFISWSGTASHGVADVLRTYLPCMLQDVEPFVSSHDLASGVRWSAELSKELDQARFGIICLTPDNLHSDWILFEAGALTKHVEGRACCLLLQGLGAADVTGPLAQFQNRTFGRAEFAKLLADLNSLLETPLADGSLQLILEKWWPDLDSKVRALLDRLPAPSASSKRAATEILEELLLRVRQLQTRVDSMAAESRVNREVDAAANASDHVRRDDNRYFVVTFGRFQPGKPELLVRLDPQMSFQRFLDQMYNYVAGYVPPYTYGDSWLFRDVDTGEVVTHARMRMDGTIEDGVIDGRKLTEVGIRPGSKLEAIRRADLPAA